MRVESGAGSQFKNFSSLVQDPDAGEGRIEVFDQGIGASLENGIQATPAVEGVADVSSKRGELSFPMKALQEGLMLLGQ